MTMPAGSHFVGIDVSKATLEVAILPDDATFRVRNDATGWAALIARLPKHGQVTVVLEATGAYHCGVAAALATAGWPPAVLNPQRSHAFIVSEGVRAKTDRSDARLLARFAQQKQPPPSPMLTETARQLKDLVACRDDLTKLRTMEQNRLHVASGATAPVHQAVLDTLSEQLRVLDQRIAELLAADPELAARTQILQSVPGIGPVLSAVLLAGLPELGSLGAKPIAALAGVAPHPRDSGARQGVRMIRGGRPTICKALYQVAVTAVRWDPVLRAHYQQLRVRRPHKVALIACARRVLGIMTMMLRDGLLWEQTRVGQGAFLPPAP